MNNGKSEGRRSLPMRATSARSPVSEVVRTKSVVGYASSDSSSAFASLRSVVSKPSVNQP